MENNSTNQLKQRKIQKMGNIIQNIIWMQKKIWKSKQYTLKSKIATEGGPWQKWTKIIPWPTQLKNTHTETKMSNHTHNNHSHNTDNDGQAKGEELRHVQMSRWIMHVRERSTQQYTRVMWQQAINNVANNNKIRSNVHPQKSWRCNTIAHWP